jgi:glycosyltransferase involved in cell wall biosynthesis
MAKGSSHVVFTGFVFGEGYHQLSFNAFIFVLAAEVGGTHPVLLEAMSFGNCILVNNTEANMEVVGDTGVPFNGERGTDDLKEKLAYLLSHPEEVEALRAKARNRVKEIYSWDMVAEDYIRLFHSLVRA